MAYPGVCWKDKSWHTLVYHGKVAMAYPGVSWEGNSWHTLVYGGKEMHGIPWCIMGR